MAAWVQLPKSLTQGGFHLDLPRPGLRQTERGGLARFSVAEETPEGWERKEVHDVVPTATLGGTWGTGCLRPVP